MKKVAFYTLGCKLNFSESSSLGRSLVKQGYELVQFGDQSDYFVINTCSVTDNADRKCRKIVREALAINPSGFIIIVGCFAQLQPEQIAKIKGVDAVLGASDKFRLPEVMDNLGKQSTPAVMACDISSVDQFHLAYSINDRTRTFLKVQDGCDYSCSFCTIPLARGVSRSGQLAEVVDKARHIFNSGVKEIVLTGVNVGDFGKVNGTRAHRFQDLVEALENIPEKGKFRISSIEPNLLTSDLINFVAQSVKFLPHFHIPLQSGSDAILKKMKRRYLTDLYRQRVGLIKNLIPDCCIGADVLVGFPGEDEWLFKETKEYLETLPLDYLHVFSYSERPNTPAAAMPGVVPKALRAQRSKILRELSERKRVHFYRSFLGATREVLFENDIKDGLILGYSDNYIRVAVDYKPELVNSRIPVHLSECQGNLVLGTVLREPITV